ncbi:MAG: 2-oxo acid dehydrogenase subunit E2, partial [Gammaproteobacteria bacterium]|nr:2-oxo acid dehydrogenase subunit E2 [Gammaproteobacteria bacterium]
MSRYVFKLPDLGEGTVEAEIVGWRVKPGDTVAEDDVLVEVMTEKAAVEVPSPVSGRVVSTNGAPGEMVPVGAELIVLDTSAAGGATAAPVKPAAATAPAAPTASAAAAPVRTAAPAAAPSAAAAVASAPRSAAHSAPSGANGGSAPAADAMAARGG